jgi:hypothetical protein
MILSFFKKLFGIFIFLILSLILKVPFIAYETRMNVLIYMDICFSKHKLITWI